MRSTASLALTTLLCLCLPARANETPTVLKALTAELTRSLQVLGETSEPPYFLSYEVTEQDTASVSGSFGVLTNSRRSRSRYLDIDLRVGDYELDNSRPVRGTQGPNHSGLARLPIEDDLGAMRAIIWNETDRRYKVALEQLTKVKTDVEVKVDAEDVSDDFSKEHPHEDIGADAPPLAVDRTSWEAKVRRYTAPFAAYGDIYDANATLYAVAETRWFVNSEGARIQTGETRYRLAISAHTKADDGMTLPRYESFTAFTADGLPDDETVATTVQRMITDLNALKEAPVVEPYVGPAILSGRAAGVFFHEILGHRVEGHRQKREDEGQTFKRKIDEQVLPNGFTISFDPLRRRIADVDLAGAYRYDNQGVQAQRVAVIEDGVLKNFLMSRTPIDGFPKSNGHGRKDIGYKPVARQSNLIVEVANAVTGAQLRRELLAAVREQGKPFGLLFKEIESGFTNTGRILPNYFNVEPTLVYRIHADGREELVRGGDLIGTPLTALSRVVAADDEVSVFNGICGAESGGVPVSSASPGILVTQIEVQKKSKSQERPPVLPPPFVDAHTGVQG